MPDQVADNAAAAVVALYNHRVINWKNFVEKREDLISNLLLSIGKANLAQLEDAEDGVRNLTALAVMTAMSIKYDTLTAPTMTKWKKTLIAKFDGRDSLENLMATHTKIHANFLRVGQPLFEYDKLCTLQAAVAQHPTVLKMTAHELGTAARLEPSEEPQALTEARVSEIPVPIEAVAVVLTTGVKVALPSTQLEGVAAAAGA
eukprot:gene660-732_t